MRGVDPLIGEARATGLACYLAEEVVDKELWLDGDAKNLVTQMVNSTSTPDWSVEAEVITIRAIMRLHLLWLFKWIPREGNFVAYKLAS